MGLAGWFYIFMLLKKMWAFCEFNMGFDDRMECRWMRTARKLFKETKHLLQTKVSAFGNRMVCIISLFTEFLVAMIAC